MHQEKIITDEKLVLQAAQSVWAMNKYLILACSQRDYQDIRKLLNQGNQDLQAAYKILKNAIDTYKDVPTKNLPQVTNALYHIAGYFKENISGEERQTMNAMILTNPDKALEELEAYSRNLEVDYLLSSSIWSGARAKPFNLVPIALTDKGKTYEPNALLWRGSYVTFK